jgi:SAM-dependent methyltransferase
MAFDALAADYDRHFTAIPTARWLRSRVHSRLVQLYPPGSNVLELGCGTGEDAAFLAGIGVAVLATDASRAMLDIARQKNASQPRIQFAQLDLNALSDSGFDGPFAGVYANFGVMNCVDDLPTLARWLATRTAPGARLGFAVMSPICLWEIGWHGVHGDFRTAFRRLRKNAVFTTEEGESIYVHYPTPKQFRQTFAPYFRQTHLQPLGIALPPSEIYAAVEKRPALLPLLTALERPLERVSLLSRFADHYWIELERV